MADKIVKHTGDKTKLAERQAWAEKYLVALKDRPVLGAEAWWAGILTLVQTVLAENEADRVEITKPINDDLKEVNTNFKTASTPLEKLKQLVKDKIAEGHQLRLDAQDAARLAAVAAATAGDSAGCNEALAGIPEDIKTPGASVAMKWEVESYNINEMTLAWLVPDHAALEAHCKNYPKSPTVGAVPGVTFRRVPVVKATRGKKT